VSGSTLTVTAAGIGQAVVQVTGDNAWAALTVEIQFVVTAPPLLQQTPQQLQTPCTPDSSLVSEATTNRDNTSNDAVRARWQKVVDAYAADIRNALALSLAAEGTNLALAALFLR